MIARVGLEHLSSREQQAIVAFVKQLKARFKGLIQAAKLFGSKARGDSSPDSDIDVLVVVDSDDWRVHKQIRYLAADVCLQYDVNLSPRVWSRSHCHEMAELPSMLYQNIHREGINLLEPSSAPFVTV